MEISKFKEKIAKLTPPWEISGSCIYCPIYMTPMNGHVKLGKPWTEDELEYCWTNILYHNRRIRIHEDYVEVPMYLSKEYIKIKINGK